MECNQNWAYKYVLSIYHDSPWHNQTDSDKLQYFRKLKQTNFEMILLILTMIYVGVLIGIIVAWTM